MLTSSRNTSTMERIFFNMNQFLDIFKRTLYLYKIFLKHINFELNYIRDTHFEFPCSMLTNHILTFYSKVRNS